MYDTDVAFYICLREECLQVGYLKKLEDKPM